MWLLPTLALATHVAIDVPAGTLNITAASDIGEPSRLEAASMSPNVFTGLLPIDARLVRSFDNITTTPNGTWVPPVCTDDFTAVCLIVGQTYDLTATLPNGTDVPLGPVDIPPLCSIAVGPFALDPASHLSCVNVTVSFVEPHATPPAAVGVYGVVLTNPQYYALINAPLFDVYPIMIANDTAEVCQLRPTGTYSVWARDATGFQCTTRFAVPKTELPTPNISETVLITSLSISFVFEFANYTDRVDYIRVNATNLRTGVSQRRLYDFPSGVVPTFSSAGAFAFRGFANFLDANTAHAVSIHVADANGTRLSPESNVIVATTARSVQPTPDPPTLDEITDTTMHLLVSPLAFEAGDTLRTELTLLQDVPDSLVDRVILNVSCPGTCPGGVDVPLSLFSGVRVAFATVVVVNTNGVSAPSSNLAIVIPRPAVPDDDDDLTGPEIAGVVLAVFAAVAALVAVVWRRASRRAIRVPVFRPAPIAGVECERDEIVLERRIGAGSTSVVHFGRFRNEEAAIKQMVSSLGYDQMQGFFGEIAQLHSIRHPNIVRLLGAVTRTDPVWIVTEFCAQGALDELLRSSADRLAALPLRKWAREMAASVMYLHRQKIIHRDIATRNFLVHADDTLKMCDLGMSKNMHYLDTYRLNKPLPISIRWASPTVIFKRVFSYASDTWSFAVTLNELYAGGELPFAGMQEDAVIAHILVEHGRPLMAALMPEDLKRIVLDIWTEPGVANTATMALFAEALGLQTEIAGLPEAAAEVEEEEDDAPPAVVVCEI